ncbi:hypothetical protein ACHAWF_017249 [Thalassiosira exigua]
MPSLQLLVPTPLASQLQRVHLPDRLEEPLPLSLPPFRRLARRRRRRAREQPQAEPPPHAPGELLRPLHPTRRVGRGRLGVRRRRAREGRGGARLSPPPPTASGRGRGVGGEGRSARVVHVAEVVVAASPAPGDAEAVAEGGAEGVGEDGTGGRRVTVLDRRRHEKEPRMWRRGLLLDFSGLLLDSEPDSDSESHSRLGLGPGCFRFDSFASSRLRRLGFASVAAMLKITSCA